MLAFLLAFLFLCFLPGACGDGGFAWQWGAQGQSCNDACLKGSAGTSYLSTCVDKFPKIKNKVDFVAAADTVPGVNGCDEHLASEGATSPAKESNTAQRGCTS